MSNPLGRHIVTVVRLDTTAQVSTPERVVLRYRLAGPGRRAAAYAIDAVCRGAILLICLVPLGLASVVVPGGSGVGMGGILLLLFLLEWGYGAIAEWLGSGRTPGKWLLGIRVVREDGSAGRMSDFLLRNLVRTADFMPGFFAVGLVSMLFDDRFRRIGDMVGGTVVVVEESEKMLGAVRVDPPVSDQERQAMPVRVDLSTEERRTIEAFMRRLPKMSRDRAEELAQLFGPTLEERTGWRAATWTRTLVLAYARAAGQER